MNAVGYALVGAIFAIVVILDVGLLTSRRRREDIFATVLIEVDGGGAHLHSYQHSGPDFTPPSRITEAYAGPERMPIGSIAELTLEEPAQAAPVELYRQTRPVGKHDSAIWCAQGAVAGAIAMLGFLFMIPSIRPSASDQSHLVVAGLLMVTGLGLLGPAINGLVGLWDSRSEIRKLRRDFWDGQGDAARETATSARDDGIVTALDRAAVGELLRAIPASGQMWILATALLVLSLGLIGAGVARLPVW